MDVATRRRSANKSKTDAIAGRWELDWISWLRTLKKVVAFLFCCCRCSFVFCLFLFFLLRAALGSVLRGYVVVRCELVTGRAIDWRLIYFIAIFNGGMIVWRWPTTSCLRSSRLWPTMQSRWWVSKPIRPRRPSKFSSPSDSTWPPSDAMTYVTGSVFFSLSLFLFETFRFLFITI